MDIKHWAFSITFGGTERMNLTTGSFKGVSVQLHFHLLAASQSPKILATVSRTMLRLSYEIKNRINTCVKQKVDTRD